MRIVFFGTPDFAAQVLDALFDASVNVVAVVTQPDRPKGRSLQMGLSAVKQLVKDRGVDIPIFQPEKASDPAFLSQLRGVRADLFVVVAYGQILSQTLLDIPPLGCINVHASLLPKFRGAAPIQRCLLAGERETGIAIQKMVRQMDAGDIIATAKMEITQGMTFGALEQALCDLAGPLLLLVLRSYENGIPPGEPQNHTLATFAPKITVEEGAIDWRRSAREILSLICAFSPRPGAWCMALSGGERRRVKILLAELSSSRGEPGVFLHRNGEVGCGQGSLKIITLQPEGKKAMSAVDWLRGFKDLPQLLS